MTLQKRLKTNECHVIQYLLRITEYVRAYLNYFFLLFFKMGGADERRDHIHVKIHSILAEHNVSDLLDLLNVLHKTAVLFVSVSSYEILSPLIKAQIFLAEVDHVLG